LGKGKEDKKKDKTRRPRRAQDTDAEEERIASEFGP